jgi:hypothetical protein
LISSMFEIIHCSFHINLNTCAILQAHFACKKNLMPETKIWRFRSVCRLTVGAQDRAPETIHQRSCSTLKCKIMGMTNIMVASERLHSPQVRVIFIQHQNQRIQKFLLELRQNGRS